MTTDRLDAIEALLVQAEAAHSVFEATELNGVYDREWPRWYAEYAVEHDIGELLGRSVTAGELARFFEAQWDELQQTDPKPSEPWAASTARQIVAQFQA